MVSSTTSGRTKVLRRTSKVFPLFDLGLFAYSDRKNPRSGTRLVGFLDWRRQDRVVGIGTL